MQIYALDAYYAELNKHIENNMNGNESGIVLGVCMKITEQDRYASRSG